MSTDDKTRALAREAGFLDRTEYLDPLIGRIARVIVDAEFSDARRADVLKRIVSIFEHHSELTSAGDSLGSLAALRGQLEKIAQTAEKLRVLIDKLPDGARTHILRGPIVVTEADVPHSPHDPLAALIERAHKYHQSVQRGSGRPRNSNLHGLLEDLATLWESELPNAAGITRDGRGEVPYKGPLLDFVRSLLDAEEIPYHSAEALGHQLWELWNERRQNDKLHAAGLCAHCEKELQDKARWLCDDCYGSWPWLQATVQKPR